MNNDKIKSLIMKLIGEANVIAPSISRFDEKNNYGSVTDEELDFDSLGSWTVESKALLSQLANRYPLVFSDLYEKLQKTEKESIRNHSKSIFVHMTRQFLGNALSLLDSPLFLTETSQNLYESLYYNVDPKYTFIAMPMNPKDHTLVDVLDAIKEAAKRCNILAERIDEPQSNERISDRILQSIQKAKYVIVDLTNSRPNVFFEAGYAHGIGNIPIYFAKYGTDIEFDLKDYPVIFYHNLKELKDSIEKIIHGLNK